MAVSSAQQKKFISEIAPIIQRYAKEYGYHVASPIIAQACIESAYGTSSLGYKYHNYFGMKCGSNWKGKSVNLSTKEEYTAGTLTSIKANFRVYDTMDEGVRGYFEFIAKSRYANLKSATTPKQYLELIKADGYATSSTYVNTNMNCVNRHNLEKYDSFTPDTIKKTITEIAYEVIDNKWGNGEERKKRLTEAGYNYNEVQTMVNSILRAKDPIEKIYIVVVGDTLTKIAQRFGVTVDYIVKKNGIQNPNKIKVGQMLRI